MATATMTINKITSKLVEVPVEKFPEIFDFIEFVLQKSKPRPKNIVKLEGIWKGLGFEKINDLESEIKDIRKRSGKGMTERIKKWESQVVLGY
jgi:hypothetical protein